MREPALVADCVKAMRDATPLPVTVKHRIGLDQDESDGLLHDFVGTVAEAGCRVFIVHARNAWLKGLSPKENRDIPPLRYPSVHRLKQVFPALQFVLNGGITTDAQIDAALQAVDGVMVGRQAYHHPWLMADWDAHYFADPPTMEPDREHVEAAMVAYMQARQAVGEAWPRVARHMLGLWNGSPGARRWRQVWSDHRLKAEAPERVSALARAARLRAAPQEMTETERRLQPAA
jgi:tRNA-dihydrouridine synthase A